MTLRAYRRFDDGNYNWALYSPKQTGLWTVSMQDSNTGVIASTSYANRNVRAAAHSAWAGARHSRAPGTGPEIMNEMGTRGVNPDEKLDEMFRTYGHASVGDMARIMVHLDNVPMHFPFAVFNASAVNSGQEKSTRYQRKFGGAVLHDLKHYLPEEVLREHPEFEREYQDLGRLSLDLFNQFRGPITNEFVKFYKPSNDKEKASLDSRVLDCVRFFLLTGQCSGFAFETSARDWSRVISYLKASSFEVYGEIGEQITQLLTNEEAEKRFEIKHQAPGLIKHTEADNTVNLNLEKLGRYLSDKFNFTKSERANNFGSLVEPNVVVIPRAYSEGERVAAQYILTLYPGAKVNSVFEFLRSLSLKEKREISDIIFEGHDHHHEMPLGEVTRLTSILESSIGEVRDFNRHRAFGRFVPLPSTFGLPYDIETASQLLDNGFILPSYIGEMPEFDAIKLGMIKGFHGYYEQAERLLRKVHNEFGDKIDYNFMINVLPLGTRMDIWMHGDPKQFSYLTNLRTRNGGHINYRLLAWDANRMIAESDSFLSGMKLDSKKLPDPRSREQFFDRS